MRKLMILTMAPLLALAACGENTGWNPNYSAMDNGSRYGKYLQDRELALQGKTPAPKVIPIELPAKAPTAAEIAGTVPKTTVKTVPARPTPATVRATVPVVAVGAGATPALVRYAHQEQHAPGTRKYQRSGGSASSAARACQKYASPDQAQQAFLAAGGPVIDPLGLDPDGDGFVCGWNPAAYRQSRL